MKGITQKYLHNVLDRTEKLEKLGHLPPGYSKEYSKKIIALVEIVPPVELKASIKNLENEIKQNLAEMESKIKNLKPKKKKKAGKKTIEQRYNALSDELKEALDCGLALREPMTFKDVDSGCCPGLKHTESFSFLATPHQRRKDKRINLRLSFKIP